MGLQENANGGAIACSAWTSDGKAVRELKRWVLSPRRYAVTDHLQLIPHADVIFLNKHYAQVHSPHYASTPRAFLLSLTSIVPQHALLVAHWGSEGSAVLSLPTKEYFQSSGWVEEKPPPEAFDAESVRHSRQDSQLEGDRTIRSVRSGSDFWAGARSRTPSSAAYTAGGMVSDYGGYYTDSGGGHRDHDSSMLASGMATPPFARQVHGNSQHGHHKHSANSSGQYTTMTGTSDYYNDRGPDPEHDNDNESQGTEVPGKDTADELVDEVGAQDAFIAGMIYALSRRLCPGLPYTPAWSGEDPASISSDSEKGRWRLDECLK